MRKTFGRLLILVMLLYLAFTFARTTYQSPEGALKQMFRYADRGDETGVEVMINTSVRRLTAVKNSFYNTYNGRIIDIRFGKTYYNSEKNLAAVDVEIDKFLEGKEHHIRNYYFMAYEPGLNWNLYYILGYSKVQANQNPFDTFEPVYEQEPASSEEPYYSEEPVFNEEPYYSEQPSSGEKFHLVSGTYDVSYTPGYLQPGEYYVRIESDGGINSYSANLKIYGASNPRLPLHAYNLGGAENEDMLFNKRVLTLTLKDGDFVDFQVHMGDAELYLDPK